MASGANLNKDRLMAMAMMKEKMNIAPSKTLRAREGFLIFSGSSSKACSAE